MVGGAFRRERNIFPKDRYRQHEKEKDRCQRTNEKDASEQSEENPPSSDSWTKRFNDCRINTVVGIFHEGAQPYRCRQEKQQNAAEEAKGWDVHRV